MKFKNTSIITAAILLFLCSGNRALAQMFTEDFESYPVNDYLGPNSPLWTTWNNADGTPEDTYVVDNNAYSGSQSIYFESLFGSGPQDVVLPFGGVHSTGRFKFNSMFYVPSGKAAYFNFQAAPTVGSVWAIEIYMRSGGTFEVIVNFSTIMIGNYPQDRWFQFTVDADLDNDKWEILFDGVSQGSFANNNSISFIDIYDADGNTEFWMDDLTYCIDKACNPDLSIDQVTINPNPVCTHDSADVSVKVTNHSSFAAPKMTLALEIGATRILRDINIGLAAGASTTVVIPKMFVSKIAGPSVAVNAINYQSDLNPANDTAKTNIIINASPSNTAIGKGTPFTTTRPLSFGTAIDPDIVAANDVLTYDITAPSGYLNSTHGSVWSISGLTVKTNHGVTVAGTNYSYTPPNPGNGKISFSPDASLTDSTVMISFTVQNISTGCDSFLTRYIYIAARPKAIYNALDACDKDEVRFMNGSTIQSGFITSLWDFGDGTTSDWTDPKKVYSGIGTYTVKLVVTSNYGYKDSVINTVTVHPIPTARVLITNKCEGAPLTFKDNSLLPVGTPTYAWEFGDGNTSTAANPTHQYASPGIYEVHFKVTVNGCSSALQHYATQAPRSKPNFTFNVGSCDNVVIPFNTTGTAPVFGSVDYTWDFGDTYGASGNNVIHEYNAFTSYKVVQTGRTDLGCIDTVSKIVTLRESPKANFTFAGNYCANKEITYTNSTNTPASSTNSYVWDFGDLNDTTSTDATHSYGAEGEYKVKLSAASSNGCSSQKEQTINIQATPKVDFKTEKVCEGSASMFTNNSTISDGSTVRYRWDFGNTAADTSLDPSSQFIYPAAGSYTVTLEARTSGGCMSSLQKTAEVAPVPAVNMQIASNLTGDGTMRFNTDATGVTYYWTFGDGGSSTVKAPVYKYELGGAWHVKLVVTSPDGCTNTVTDIANVNPLSVQSIEAGSGWLIYPNPSAGRFNIKTETALGNDAVVTIINITGQLIKTYTYSDFVNDELAVNMEDIAAGIYLVQMQNNGTTNSKRITITR